MNRPEVSQSSEVQVEGEELAEEGGRKQQAVSMIYGYAQSKSLPDLAKFPLQKRVQETFRNQKVTLKFTLYHKDKAGFEEVQPYYVRYDITTGYH